MQIDNNYILGIIGAAVGIKYIINLVQYFTKQGQTHLIGAIKDLTKVVVAFNGKFDKMVEQQEEIKGELRLNNMNLSKIIGQWSDDRFKSMMFKDKPKGGN